MTKIVLSDNTRVDLITEAVEIKGTGHPDTITDKLAELISREYSNYTKKKFGAILHHNFDKLELLGGRSYVEFGNGYLTKPIRVIVNGRASDRFGNNKIPLKEIIKNTTINYLKELFPSISENNIKFYFFISTASSPGHRGGLKAESVTRNYWFKPRSLQDLKELAFLASNDTSLGCSYAPYSDLEHIVILLERELCNSHFSKINKWLGTDIKIMAIRQKKNIFLTLCIPQIANHVNSLEEYKNNLTKVDAHIKKKLNKYSDYKFDVSFNTRDKYNISELYLTAIGSSIESGDEGVVGRGNRVNGIITPFRPMSIEGAAGKNPVYHVGKIYNISSKLIAEQIYKETGKYNEVYMISQSGRALTDPWMVIVNIKGCKKYEKVIKSVIYNHLKSIPRITEKLLKSEINIY